jgi:hypothetical protein
MRPASEPGRALGNVCGSRALAESTSSAAAAEFLPHPRLALGAAEHIPYPGLDRGALQSAARGERNWTLELVGSRDRQLGRVTLHRRSTARRPADRAEGE